MATEDFQVQNIKCGGCTKTIEEGLAELPGVSKVVATIEGGKVEVEGEGLSRDIISSKLAELGYPEA